MGRIEFLQKSANGTMVPKNFSPWTNFVLFFLITLYRDPAGFLRQNKKTQFHLTSYTLSPYLRGSTLCFYPFHNGWEAAFWSVCWAPHWPDRDHSDDLAFLVTLAFNRSWGRFASSQVNANTWLSFAFCKAQYIFLVSLEGMNVLLEGLLDRSHSEGIVFKVVQACLQAHN